MDYKYIEQLLERYWISFVRGSGICHAASEIAGGYAGGRSG